MESLGISVWWNRGKKKIREEVDQRRSKYESYKQLKSGINGMEMDHEVSCLFTGY